MSLDDLTDEDTDVKSSSSSSKRRYVQPDRGDFENFLESTGLGWKLEEDSQSNEHVYEAHSAIPDYTGVVLRTYSTIDERTDKARSKGSDAIRLVIWDKNIEMPIGGRKKTLRIETWRKNLRKKIKSLVEEWEDIVAICDDCGDLMVLRDGKYGEFYGCRNYPSCDNTEQIEDNE